MTLADKMVVMNGGAVEQLATPHDLYFSPCSRFAAEFIGSSSLIPAQMEQAGTARLQDGTEVQVQRRAASGAGHIMLRPESIGLCRAGEEAAGWNVVIGTLRDTLVTGGLVKHFVALPDGTTVTVQELANQQRTAFAPGEHVSITWPIEAGLFLDR